MIDSEPPGERHRLIIRGDNPLAYRLAADLISRSDALVTVILPSREHNYGPRIAALPGVRLVEAAELSADAYQSAGLAQADALALVDQDDVGNIHAALRAHEVNPRLRLVIRFFNMSLGYRIRELFPGSVVLSDAAAAAPSFVAAALGEVTPGSARLPGRPRRSVVVARRADVAAARVVCGLADTTAADGPVRLPADEQRADLVLALAEDADRRVWAARRRAWRRAAAAFGARLRALLSRKLALAAFGLFVLLGLGTALFAEVGNRSWSEAMYLTVLDAAGAAQPDPRLSAADKVIQALVTVIGIAFIPVLTAAVVDAIVSARLDTALGRPRPMSNHVVVVGLGNVGARALQQLHELGVPVVGVERDEQARGVPRARRLGVPVVIGDASREDTLREAYLAESSALVAVTNNDLTNLEAALHGRVMRPELRVALRLFDDDLAQRVEHTFGINVSRSVSFLSAPAFAAAMLQRQVLATIPVGRQVLLIAEVPVPAGCPLVSTRIRELNIPEQTRVIALQRRARESLDLPAPPEHLLTSGDRLIVVTTRTGLAELSTRAHPAPPAADREHHTEHHVPSAANTEHPVANPEQPVAATSRPPDDPRRTVADAERTR
jgi:Trk K+ transport system NAD-binding subunit